MTRTISVFFRMSQYQRITADRSAISDLQSILGGQFPGGLHSIPLLADRHSNPYDWKLVASKCCINSGVKVGSNSEASKIAWSLGCELQLRGFQLRGKCGLRLQSFLARQDSADNSVHQPLYRMWLAAARQTPADVVSCN